MLPDRHRPSRTALVLVAAAAALVVVLLLATAWGITESQPSVKRDTPLSAEPIQRLKSLLLQQDPRQRQGETTQQLHLPASDLDVLLHDGLRRAVQGSARLELAQGAALLEASLPLRQGPLARVAPLRFLAGFGPWLNVRLIVRQDSQGQPDLVALKLGRLPMPPGLALWLVDRGVRQLHLEAEYALAREAIERLKIEPSGVQLTYRWQSAWRDRVKATVVPPADQARLRAYVEQLTSLVAVGRDRPAGRPVRLVDLLLPLLQLADSRAAAQAAVVGSSEAAAEHRAALVALALYAAGQPPARIVPTAQDWPIPAPRQVTLRGREDFAQHFLVSAVIAAEGGGRLADMIGVYKELADTRDGSGFSFNDIAADRAGTRFGQIAAGSPQELQRRLHPSLSDADLLPPVDDLPEFLTAEAFRQRYGDVASPAYREMLALIESRMAALPLLR